jgi:hypothetical protein
MRLSMMRSVVAVMFVIALGACSDPVAISRSTSHTSEPTDVFLVAGQSNARGPLGLSTYPTLKASIGTFSAWPSFAVEYHRLTGRDVSIVNARVGGSSQTWQSDRGRGNGSWDSRGTLWAQSVAMLDSFTAVPAGIIWVQGEADAGAIYRGTLTRSQYERALQAMILRYREKYGPVPFYIVRTGRLDARDTDGHKAVRRAQERVALNDPLTWVVYERAVTFADRGLMADNVHWATPGLQEVGRVSARFIAAIH